MGRRRSGWKQLKKAGLPEHLDLDKLIAFRFMECHRDFIGPGFQKLVTLSGRPDQLIDPCAFME